VHVVLDTNVFLSALISPAGPPAAIYEAWRHSRFELFTWLEQLDELARVTRYPGIRPFITPAEAGRMLNQVRGLATVVERLPRLDVSTDPADNFLFALVEVVSADFLITGDKSGVLRIGKRAKTRIVRAAEFASLLR
jgi:uncharacterized protein